MRFAGAGVGVLASRNVISAAQATSTQDRHFEHGKPLQEFQYSQIEFEPGPHEAQLEQTHSILMQINVDSLLKPFRHHAGLPAPGRSLGGQYDSLDAESFGLFLQALARYYGIKKDERTRARVQHLVSEFALTIEPGGKIFPSKFGPYHSINTAKFRRIVRGLLDAHRFTQNPIALDTLARMMDAVMPRLPSEAASNSKGGWSMNLPETAFYAWQYTGDQRHLELAKRCLYQDYYDKLARGENCLAGLNGLGHVMTLNSAAKAYLVLGDEKYLSATRNGLRFVEETQSYATGAWGPLESFIPVSMPGGSGEAGGPEGLIPQIKSLGDSLTRTHAHFQIAGADAHFSVARYLLRITKEAAYGDSIERLMYNTVLGALPLQEDGRAFYYCDYHRDGQKIYGYEDGEPRWSLEAAILPVIATDYRLNTYLHDDEGVYVNLFIPSTVEWRQNGSEVSLKQTGTYPLGDKVALTLTISRPLEFNLRLRIPAWTEQPSIRVNGRQIAAAVKPGTFASLRQKWRSGDQIELELPRQLVLKAVDSEHPDLVALVYEPLVLFAVTTETPQFTRKQLLSAERAGAESHEWRVNASGRSIRFTPFWIFKHERYSTYLSVMA